MTTNNAANQRKCTWKKAGPNCWTTECRAILDVGSYSAAYGFCPWCGGTIDRSIGTSTHYSEEPLLTCPFCKENDFDEVGLKIHYECGYCDIYNAVQTGPRPADQVTWIDCSRHPDDKK